jgi:alpha-glucosidase
LLPLLSRLSESAADGDLAMIRPLFLHFADDPATHLVEDQFLLGADLMVAPVLHATATSRSVYLPAGCDWAHLWTGERFPGGQRLTVSAPVGEPPVFWRATSDDAALFAGLAASN